MRHSIDYPAALDADGIEIVVGEIQTNYPAHELRVHDTGTLHFAYFDTNDHYIATDLLHHIQAAGYSLLHTGRERAPASGQWCGWMECRKYAPDERDLTLTCPRCDHTFTPITVPHQIVGQWSAYYTCPACSNRLEASPPRPAISDSSGGDAR